VEDEEGINVCPHWQPMPGNWHKSS
jgi:hypothetical protein